MTHYLYLEVEGIQRFVFASPKLKIIRGGSALLDTFNRVDMVAAAKKKGGNVVFVGGGHGLVRGLSRDDAEGLGKELGRMLRKVTDNQVSLAWGVAPESDDWGTTWKKLHDDLTERAMGMPSAPPPLPPFVALCSSCGVSPARGLEDMQDRQLDALCNACSTRLKEARKIDEERGRKTIWWRLRPHFEQKRDDDAFKALLPDREFKKLAELGSRQEYLAYLYCDGNGMGKKLREAESANEYQQLSTLVDTALHKAVAAGIEQHCSPEKSKHEGKFSAEVLLLGGDDLIVALPADRGVDFTQTVLTAFHRETHGKLRLSAGLVLAPHKTPITILQHVANSLLHSAKRYAYLDELRQRLGRRIVSEKVSGPPRPPAVGYIDFQELTSAQIDIERRDGVTCRPYRLDDFATLVERIRKLQAADVPAARLHALAEAVHGSEREANTMARLLIGRARDNQQRDALRGLLSPFQIIDGPTRCRPYITYPNSTWDVPFDLYRGTEPESHRWSVIPEALELFDHLVREGGA